MSNDIIFICEASLNIGTGHVVRCLTLAQKLQDLGFKCSFVTSQQSLKLINKLESYQIINPNEFFKDLPNFKIAIFDNYNIDYKAEEKVAPFCEKILVIDDLADRKHHCHILLDQNLYSKTKDYKNLVPTSCKILTGTKYCLLRPEFSELREKALQKRQDTKSIKKILVNFGGSDIKNYNLEALKKIETVDSFKGEIDVILGFKAIYLDQITEFSKKSKNNINIFQEANMAQKIYEADMAIAAGGTSTWERCCLGLPTFLIKIASNQDKIFEVLGQKSSFEEFFNAVSNNYQKFSEDIFNYVDGLGVDRVIKELINPTAH